MPLFNYKCLECDKVFEKLVISSDEKIICPLCKSENLKKLYPNKLGIGTNRASSSVPISGFS